MKNRSLWVSLSEHLRYRLEQVFAGGSFAQFALLTFFTGLVVLFGMSAFFFGLRGDRRRHRARQRLSQHYRYFLGATA